MKRVAAVVAALAIAAAPAAAETLRVAVGGAFTSMDPHYFNLAPTMCWLRERMQEGIRAREVRPV